MDITIDAPKKHICRCKDEHNEETPTIIASQLPHKVRHAAIFGAMDSLKDGASLVVVASHEPKPLIVQAQKRYEKIGIEFLQEGPQEWHVRFTR